MRKRIAKYFAALAILAIFAWGAAALANQVLLSEGPVTPGRMMLLPDGGALNHTDPLYGQFGFYQAEIQTVSSSSAVVASTIAVWPGSVDIGTTTIACMSLTACTGGSAGDWYTRTFQWNAIYAPGSGGPVIELAPTTIGVVSNGTSMSGVTSTAVASGTNVLIEISTEPSCNVDCSARTDVVAVN